MSRQLLIATFALALASACGGNGSGNTDGGNTCTAKADGEACSDSSECCSGRCPDGTCIACIALDSACSINTECCSGRCENGSCVPDTCLDQGVACTTGDQCCSQTCGTNGLCEAQLPCSTFGSACTMNDDCCSHNCADPAGGECTGSGCSCAPSIGCAAAGDPCTSDDQCCNNLCDRPGGGSGFCAAIGGCQTAGEPCGTAGFNGSCCSTVCLDGDGEGINRCQYLGGCRVQDDLCSFDAECCSGACEVNGYTQDGREIKRCANADSCLPVGEVCGGQGGSSNCCPDGGGRAGCEPTGAGFSRCLYDPGGCTPLTMDCTDTADCCDMPSPNAVCGDSVVTGGKACCLPDGEICAFGDLCCGGVCSPSTDPNDPDGTLRCGSVCTPDGGACTSDAECCNCCTNGACTSDCACTGPQLGEPCDPIGEPCCNAPTVSCQGTEFPTCSL